MVGGVVWCGEKGFLGSRPVSNSHLCNLYLSDTTVLPKPGHEVHLKSPQLSTHATTSTLNPTLQILKMSGRGGVRFIVLDLDLTLCSHL